MIGVFFKTYGCQANVADSQGLMRYFQDLGCNIVNKESNADLIVVNSCAVRAKAEQKMFSYLGQLSEYKKRRPYLRIGVIGCVASYKKDEMFSRFDHLNFVFGAREDMSTFRSYLFDLITMLETAKQLFSQVPAHVIKSGQDRDIVHLIKTRQRRNITPVLQPNLLSLSPLQATNDHEVKRSFINIMTGCNNYCTYCIVPFTRGREKSYSMKSIVDRVQREIANGSKEITLIGQNVNSYKDPDTGASFALLLRKVAKIEGDFWVRYTSPHPKDMTCDVLEVMAEHKDKLSDWVHMPLQAGSDKVLSLMGRPYTVQRYMEVIGWVREFLSDATITTDIIVGFPGETEEEYLGTREVMEQVKYDHIYSFIYSKRKYTKAYSMSDDCPEDVKQQRLEGLQKRQKQICLERNERLIGRSMRVLVEKRLSHGRLLARTSGNVRVFLDGHEGLIGTFVYVVINKANVANIEGSLI